MSRLARLASLCLAAVCLVAALSGCNAEQLAQNPLGPCGDDARSPGGFPDLEAKLPATFGPDGAVPDRVDSGRSCSDTALGTLKSHGITELDFAGATWNEDSSSEGTVIAVVQAPRYLEPLETSWVEEFYEAGARNGKKTDNIEVSRPGIGAIGEVFWLDTINDLSFQTVAVWPGDGVVHVVIVATDVAPLKDRGVHAQHVEDAIRVASGGEPSSSEGCACGSAPPATAPAGS